MKGMLKIMFCFLLSIFVLLLFFGFSILSFGLRAKPVISDAIIVLGCQVYGTVPSAFLKARLDEGLRLYNEGYGKYIVVSGGKGKGENISEAEAMKDYLVSNSVDTSRIILEDKSRSTIENIQYSSKIIKSIGLNSAVIVSNKYHLKRALLIAEKYGLKASCSGVFVSNHIYHEITGFFREILALLKFYIV